MVGLDSSILMHSKVWEASGHIQEFSDPLSDCRKCKHRFCPSPGQSLCPNCGSSDITPARNFHLMFKSSMGPVEGKGSTVYLRPETAQGIYVNFLNVQQSLRLKVPFGIAQIGKAFRNEITPSHFIFRMREFEQMEMQFFIPPEKEQETKWFEDWKNKRVEWLIQMGLKKDDLLFNTHQGEELAHYAKYAEDIEYKFSDPLGQQELEGLHVRGDFDLSSHQKFSGKKLKYFDPDRKTSYLPHIIETSIGCDRLFLALLSEAYREEEMEDGKQRVVLDLNPLVAPVQVAILPLQKNPEILSLARKIQQELGKTFFTEYDESGSIGKRYRRQDEIGTPLCVTVDFDSLQNQDVTVRRMDTLDQMRIPIAQLEAYLNEPSTFKDPAGLSEWASTFPLFKEPPKQDEKEQAPPRSTEEIILPEDRVPPAKDFYYPILELLGKNRGDEETSFSLSEIQSKLKSYFNLSDKALKWLTRGGNQTKFINRINWTLSHLKKLNYIKKEGKKWGISDKGRAFLDKDIENKEEFLIKVVRCLQRGIHTDL